MCECGKITQAHLAWIKHVSETVSLCFQGCYDLVTSFMETNMGIIARVTFGTAFLHRIGMLLACCLFRFITANPYETV